MYRFLSAGNRLASIVLLSTLVCFVSSADVQIPFVSKNVTAKKEDSKETLTSLQPLNPAALSPDWWRDIVAKPAQRTQHIHQAINDLREYFVELPEQRKIDIEPIVERSVASLKVYAEMDRIKPPTQVARQPFAESYTLWEWLEVSRKSISVQAEIESDRDDIKRMEKRIATMRHQFDTMTAAYLNLPENNVDKAVSGLELIGYWAGIVTLEARQKAHKLSLTALKETAGYLDNELKVANNRIRVDEKDLKRLDKQIKQNQKALDETHDELIRIEGRGFVIGNDSAVAKAGNRLQEQQLVDANVNDALQMLTLIRLQNLRDIALLLSKPNDNQHLDEIRNEQRQRQRDTETISENVPQWREMSTREQGLAGEALADMAVSDGADAEKLKKIHSSRLALAQQTLLSLQRIDDELHDVEVTSNKLNDQLIKTRGLLWDWTERSRTALVAIFETGTDWLSQSLFKIGDTPVTLMGLLRVALIITIAWWISALIRRGLARIGDSGKVANIAFLYTLGRLLHYVLITLGIIIGLSSIGVDFTNLALIAGALGVGMGFGLQTIVSNFVSGLIVLFESSLRVGDFVELDSGVTGEVKEINVRSTLIRTNDNVDVLVPNSEFIGGKVINWTLTDAIRRVHVPFGVAYGSDKELVRKAVLEAVENVPWSLKHPRKDRAPQVWLTGFGDSSLDFELVVWIIPEGVKRPNAVQAAYLWEIETALSKYQIEIPFPQRDLHLRSGFERLQQSRT